MNDEIKLINSIVLFNNLDRNINSEKDIKQAKERYSEYLSTSFFSI